MDQVPRRILQAIGGPGILDRLAGLSGSDFASLMLAVARQRAAAETPPSILRRYRADPWVRPADAGWQRIRSAEEQLAAHLPAGTEMVSLPPLVPLGTHAVLGPVSQDKVVTTLRGSEVAADPTNALALEAAVRRRAAGAAGAAGVAGVAGERATVRLAAIQRVVRAPAPPPAAGYLAHFSLLGLVTAGRDDGGHRFEREAVAEHVRALAHGLAAAGLGVAQLALTPLSPAGEVTAASLRADLAAAVEVVLDHGRPGGRGYYRDLCFKINVRPGEGSSAAGAGATSTTATGWAEVGDGGFTDWTARLTASAKERLLISGVGIDRVVMLAHPGGTQAGRSLRPQG